MRRLSVLLLGSLAVVLAAFSARLSETPELPETIRELVRCSDVMMMQNHGSVTLGTNLMDAYKKLDMLEHTAKLEAERQIEEREKELRLSGTTHNDERLDILFVGDSITEQWLGTLGLELAMSV